MLHMHLITIKHINHNAQSIKQDLRTLLTKIKESLPDISNIQSIDGFISYTCNIVVIHVGEALLTLSTRMPYGTSWPDDSDAVAVQLDKMIINHREADSWLFTRVVSRIMHAT